MDFQETVKCTKCLDTNQYWDENKQQMIDCDHTDVDEDDDIIFIENENVFDLDDDEEDF